MNSRFQGLLVLNSNLILFMHFNLRLLKRPSVSIACCILCNKRLYLLTFRVSFRILQSSFYLMTSFRNLIRLPVKIRTWPESTPAKVFAGHEVIRS